MFQISCAVATDFPASVLWVWIGPRPVHLKFSGSKMWGIIRRKGLKGVSEKQIPGCHSFLGGCLIGQGDLEVGEQLRRLDPRREDQVLGITF